MSVSTLMFAILLFVACADSVREKFLNTDSGPFEMLNRAWMSNFPETTPLSVLAIPGTQHSMAFDTWGPYQTQALNLKDQLDAGIRALHIGLRHTKDRFAVHYGVKYLKMMFGDVLITCNEFLEKNPREVILIFLEKQLDEEECSRSFKETFNWYRDKSDHGFNIWSGSVMPILLEVRGYIVIFDAKPGVDNVGIPQVPMEQHQIVDALWEIEDKKELVLRHMLLTKEDSRLYVNWLGGDGWGVDPYYLAKEVNLYVFDRLSDEEKAFYHALSTNRSSVDLAFTAKCYRVMMMDFPGQDLIRLIMSINYRWLYSKRWSYSEVFGGS